jgi:hypothetical protein
MIEFAEVYYHMNRALFFAGQARQSHDAAAERVALEQLSLASARRDALEDRCVAQGFFAEPVMNQSYYADLLFMWAGKRNRARVHMKEFTAEFAF